MNETTFGYPWDISWSPEVKDDTIMIEYDGQDLYLTQSDLVEMLDALQTDSAA